MGTHRRYFRLPSHVLLSTLKVIVIQPKAAVILMFVKRAKQFVVMLMATNLHLLRRLNEHHQSLSDTERARFHLRYGKIFRPRVFQRLVRYPSARWSVRFMNREIVMPLHRDNIYLDWAAAVSITAHEIEIKRMYSDLIASGRGPDLFFDVGANYGTHSILFRSANIPVVAFEPNPSCLEFCEAVCKLNRLSLPRWEKVAIGDRVGSVNLAYPEEETWLGSVSSVEAQSPFVTRKIISHSVKMRPLDDFFDEAVGKRLLIKIDVEGFELEVLSGASRILASVQPNVIFESIDHSLRVQLFELFTKKNYSIFALRPNDDPLPLPMAGLFVQSQATNFFAKPNATKHL